MSCSLCTLKIKKYIYEENDKFIIIDCMSCLVPMIVWREHTMTISEEDTKLMERHLNFVGIDKFGIDKFEITKDQRAVLDHLHWHARPK